MNRLLFILVFPIVFSCTSNDNISENISILGIWKLVKIKDFTNDFEFSKERTIEFKDNNTYIDAIETDLYFGNWSVENPGILYMSNFEGGLDRDLTIDVFKKTELVVSCNKDPNKDRLVYYFIKI